MRPRFLLALTIVLALFSRGARADEQPTLARAEAAYLAIDFESAKSLSRDALLAGSNDPASTLRLYTLLGISASALGDEDAARDAFRYVVALDPNGRLDKTLSPKVRSPYLEVRGQLGANGDIKPLEARLTHQGNAVRLELGDPAGVAHDTSVSYRLEHARAFVTVELAAGEVEVAQAPAGVTRAEYQLVVHDQHGNALYRRGTSDRPDTLALTMRDYGIEGPKPEAAHPGPYYLASGLLAAAGLGAVGVGAYFTVQREHAAHEWNSASCEQPGASRSDQCASVDERRARAEHLAIGFYAGGGALLAGSLVTLLLAPRAVQDTPRRARLPCSPHVVPLGASCSLSF